jgi:hypothetical protein
MASTGLVEGVVGLNSEIPMITAKTNTMADKTSLNLIDEKIEKMDVF